MAGRRRVSPGEAPQSRARKRREPRAVKDNTGWRYSPWTGIMYGNVPVGIIVAVIAILIFTMLD